jgi:hypothetical protein
MFRWVVLFVCVNQIAFAFGSPNTQPSPSEWSQEFEESRQDPIGNALRVSHISKDDSVQIRINKLLFLLNHNNYLDTFDLDEQGNGSPRFQELKEKDQQRIRQIFRDGGYELDSLRTTEEILGYRCGGHCSAHARSFARLLEESGVAGERIRLVSAVNDEDLKKICPGKKGQSRNAHYEGGASGHVFVLLQLQSGVEASWTLINTTQDPIRPDFKGQYRGIHGEALSELLKKPHHESHQFSLARELLEKLDSSDVEMTSWSEFSFSPVALKKTIGKGPVAIPARVIRSGSFKPMTVFSVESSKSYLRHTFQDRLNLIASGEVKNPHCRYDCSRVPGDSSPCGVRHGAKTNTK